MLGYGFGKRVLRNLLGVHEVRLQAFLGCEAVSALEVLAVLVGSGLQRVDDPRAVLRRARRPLRDGLVSHRGGLRLGCCGRCHGVRRGCDLPSILGSPPRMVRGRQEARLLLLHFLLLRGVLRAPPLDSAAHPRCGQPGLRRNGGGEVGRGLSAVLRPLRDSARLRGDLVLPGRVRLPNLPGDREAVARAAHGRRDSRRATCGTGLGACAEGPRAPRSIGSILGPSV
mmetsp:Transcript_84055/g.211963  ORF Transcript_84055/g.211963 Transcript_84055/m.211963 type:complete len:227 (+) Transcript_84055:101-781(+)